MNKQKPDGLDLLFYFTIVLIAVLILVSATSCAVFSKHKSAVKTDSTSVVKEKTDSSVIKEFAEVTKTETQEEGTIILDFSDSTKSDDYFSVSKQGEIKTSKVPVRVIIKTTKQAKGSDSMASRIAFVEHHSKIEEVQVKKEVKKSQKAKYSFNLLWLLWLLLIPVGFWIWKNKSKIMAFYPF